MKILYFAWVRERLNRGSETLDLPGTVTTVAELIDWKISRDAAFALVFRDREVIRAAIDDELVDHDATVSGAREISFFPPVTGG